MILLMACREKQQEPFVENVQQEEQRQETGAVETMDIMRLKPAL